MYFSPSQRFGDERSSGFSRGHDLRGIGAYGYALVDSSLGGSWPDIAPCLCAWVTCSRATNLHILMTPHGHIHRTPGAGSKAVTWALPADLEEANRLLSEKFDTEPVSDPRGMAAVKIPPQSSRRAQPSR